VSDGMGHLTEQGQNRSTSDIKKYRVHVEYDPER